MLCLTARIDCRVLYDCLRWWLDTEGYKAVIRWVVLQRAATTGWVGGGGQFSLHSGGGVLVRDQKLEFKSMRYSKIRYQPFYQNHLLTYSEVVGLQKLKHII